MSCKQNCTCDDCVKQSCCPEENGCLNPSLPLSCAHYSGLEITCLGITNADTGDSVINKIAEKLCPLIDGTGDNDEKVKVSSGDSTKGYLDSKIVKGTYTKITKQNSLLNESLVIDIDYPALLAALPSDKYVKVSSTDTTSSYLIDKIKKGNLINLIKSSGAEFITIEVDDEALDTKIDGLIAEAPIKESPLVTTNTSSISFGGTSGHSLTANVKISSQSNNDLELKSDGLYLNVPNETPLSATNSSSVDFTLGGTANHSVTASVKISATAGNVLSLNSDGLFVTPETELSVTDTNTINLTATGTAKHLLTAAVKISSEVGNTLYENNDGLYVPTPTVSQSPLTVVDSTTINLTTSGSAGHTLTADVKLSEEPNNALVSNNGLYVPASVVYTANNGITKVSNNFKLGGDIIDDTTLTLKNTGGHNLLFRTDAVNNYIQVTQKENLIVNSQNTTGISMFRSNGEFISNVLFNKVEELAAIAVNQGFYSKSIIRGTSGTEETSNVGRILLGIHYPITSDNDLYPAPAISENDTAFILLGRNGDETKSQIDYVAPVHKFGDKVVISNTIPTNFSGAKLYVEDVTYGSGITSIVLKNTHQKHAQGFLSRVGINKGLTLDQSSGYSAIGGLLRFEHPENMVLWSDPTSVPNATSGLVHVHGTGNITGNIIASLTAGMQAGSSANVEAYAGLSITGLRQIEEPNSIDYTGTVDDYYGIYISDLSQYLGGTNVTRRNAIYQQGENDKNFFYGRTTFGNFVGFGDEPEEGYALKAYGNVKFTGKIENPPQALTSGTTVVWNMDGGTNAEVTLSHNATLLPQYQAPGTYGTLVVKQDSVGGRTLTLPALNSKVINNGSGAVTLSTAPNSVDIISYYYDGTYFYWTYGLNYN